MRKDLLHRPALEALIALAIAPPRWRNKSDLAADCGFTPSTLSNALSGRRNLSDAALTALCSSFSQATDEPAPLFRDALVLPWHARPGDVRTEEVVRELRATQARLTELVRAVMTNEG